MIEYLTNGYIEFPKPFFPDYRAYDTNGELVGFFKTRIEAIQAVEGIDFLDMFKYDHCA